MRRSETHNGSDARRMPQVATVQGRLLLLCCIAFCGSLHAQSPAVKMAATINRHFEGYWLSSGTTPAPATTDAEFLRRVTLDLVGRIPTAAELRSFLADPNPHKREQAIERLAESPQAARHMALVLRRMWLPQTDVVPHNHLGDELESWLASELQQRTPYDQLAKAVLTATPGENDARDSAPATFLLANEMRPEDLASNATREFLGANLECAQCHDHPFASWTKDNFWQTAAFFVSAEATEEPPTLAIPDTEDSVRPELWTGEKLHWPTEQDRSTGRKLFANWIASRENTYFSRNVVNRMWAYYFGLPLHRPIDDLSSIEASQHFELLDALARDFTEGGCDLVSLSRALTLSRVYQLASYTSPEELSSGDDDETFSRARVRCLSGEQLYDSLLIATGRPVLSPDLASDQLLTERRHFVDDFFSPMSATPRRSVVQSLRLMNGPVVTRLTDPASCPLVLVASDGPFMDDQARVELMVLSILGRKPDEGEQHVMQRQLVGASSSDQQQKALGGICWALLNTVEFNTNH